ncbi:MAG: hypothetical protein AB7R89_27045 [Dehalococcoidia bacterium]
MMTPWLFLLRDHQKGWPRACFLLLFPLLGVYWLVMYIILTPLRLLNAIYFDLILLVSARSSDHALHFPGRLWLIVQGVAMAVFDAVWPSLTLFHGTESGTARDIVESGYWKAGYGDYVGTGIYFGIWPHVAMHYARTCNSPTVVVSRVTLGWCRPVATLPKQLRDKIGRNGRDINAGVKFPWAALVHWRHDNYRGERGSSDRTWHEFCLMQPHKDTPVRVWRARPLCTIGGNPPKVGRDGATLWPRGAAGWALLCSTLMALWLLSPPADILNPATTSSAVLSVLGPANSGSNPPARTQLLPPARLFILTTLPMGCHAEPEADASITVLHEPGTVQSIDQVMRMTDGVWHREVDRKCWVRTDPGPVQSFSTRAEAESAAAPFRSQTSTPVHGPTFIVTTAPVGCHRTPDANAAIAVQLPLAVVHAMDQYVWRVDGQWHREVDRQCWVRTDPGPLIVFGTLAEAERAAPHR